MSLIMIVAVTMSMPADVTLVARRLIREHLFEHWVCNDGLYKLGVAAFSL